MAATKPVTVLDLCAMKRAGQKITMLTSYDATFARLLDASGVDILLVGDSLGMVMQGRANTLKVSVDDMVYHGACVSRAVQRAHVVVDMPFMSYHVSVDEAIRNAGRLVQEGGAHSVKLEGGAERCEVIRGIVAAQIPVMGHIGLTPQSFHVQGGFKVQGRGEAAASQLLKDALAVEEAGAYALVLEGIPKEVAAKISERLRIPTIGIGAGKGCDGQVLVIQDLLGMDESFKPRFVRRYAEVGRIVRESVGTYIDDVRSGAFPDDAHSFHDRPPREGPIREAPVSDVPGYGPGESASA
ncbi:MAG: 3-methyl-2-oxobutanoate hydroxymethyltransferase [Myxococcota bacterium]|nr:3-methyl-2-oxobutanoate hydroxymethyltransferase [Myxococcota bacterium]